MDAILRGYKSYSFLKFTVLMIILVSIRQWETLSHWVQKQRMFTRLKMPTYTRFYGSAGEPIASIGPTIFSQMEFAHNSPSFSAFNILLHFEWLSIYMHGLLEKRHTVLSKPCFLDSWSLCALFTYSHSVDIQSTFHEYNLFVSAIAQWLSAHGVVSHILTCISNHSFCVVHINENTINIRTVFCST